MVFFKIPLQTVYIHISHDNCIGSGIYQINKLCDFGTQTKLYYICNV